MNIVEHNFIDVPDFLRRIQHYPSLGWIYRGQGDESWPLVPKAGRDDYFDPEWNQKHDIEKNIPPQDLGRFNAWREQVVAYSKEIPDEPLECLAYAQHYGLATRLLDWSSNPLVALYFAAETQYDVDGAVYCYLPWLNVKTMDVALDQNCPRVPKYIPRPFDSRVSAQNAIFTVHSPPEIPLTPSAPPSELRAIASDNTDLIRFVVTADAKRIILSQLTHVGIDRKRLFPDLDGLSDFINWETRRLLNGKKEKDEQSTGE